MKAGGVIVAQWGMKWRYRTFAAAAFSMSAFALVHGGCASAGYERAAGERYGDEVRYVPNADGTFILALEERDLDDGTPIREVRFFLYDTSRGQVVYERTSTFRGSVSWEDEHRVRVVEIPGIVKIAGPAATEYLVDARTGRRVAPGGNPP